MEMGVIEILIKAWPILLAIITLIIVLAKLDLRVAVLEEKMKTLFDLFNPWKVDVCTIAVPDTLLYVIEDTLKDLPDKYNPAF